MRDISGRRWQQRIPSFVNGPCAAQLLTIMRAILRGLPILVAAALVVSCAARAPIARLKADPRYRDEKVTVTGTVTTSWSVPMVPFRLYKVEDATGALTVISRQGRTPPRGARVRVTGRLSELATIGGQPLGLHLEEEHLDVSGW